MAPASTTATTSFDKAFDLCRLNPNQAAEMHNRDAPLEDETADERLLHR